MEQEYCNSNYTLYYDETNNIRSLSFEFDKYNIDNDQNQTSSPIFILSGVAHRVTRITANFDKLLTELRLQKTTSELKFSQMVKIKASYSPEEAFKYALGSSRFKTFFDWLLDSELFIHCSMINTIYWGFIDIIEDMVLCSGEQSDFLNHLAYKDYLYRLIKLDKSGFISLMHRYEFPNISKDKSLSFLSDLRELALANIAKIYQDKNNEDVLNLLNLDLFFYKCQNLHVDDLDFLFVRDESKYILIKDFSFFYAYRIKTFPKSKQILDNEYKIKAKLEEIRKYDAILNDIDFCFKDSKDNVNLLIQLSDIIAGFFFLFFNYIENSSVQEVENFTFTLNNLQKETLHLFKKNLDKATNECNLFIYRTIVPSDEIKCGLLFNSLI